MNLSRVGIMCLAALVTTALWGAIIYFGGWLIGVRMDIEILLSILGAIFLVALFCLALVKSVGDDSGANGNQDEGI